MPQNSVLNFVGWVLVASGSISFLAAAAAACYLLFSPSVRDSTKVLSSLHDTYYVVSHSKMSLWPFILCMSLSATIVIFGYAFTSHYMTRTFGTKSDVTSKA